MGSLERATNAVVSAASRVESGMNADAPVPPPVVPPQQWSPTDVLYKDGLSLVERGLTAEGVELIDQIFQRYEVPPYSSSATPSQPPDRSSKSSRTILDWFMKHGGQD